MNRRPATSGERELAVKLRLREIAWIHLGQIEKRVALAPEQRVAVHEQFTVMLLEAAGRPDVLVPNPLQLSEAKRMLRRS